MGRKTHPAQCRPLKRRPHLGSCRRTGKRARRVQLPFRHPNQGRCRSHLLHVEAPKSPAHRSRPRPPLRKTHSEWRLAQRLKRNKQKPTNLREIRKLGKDPIPKKTNALEAGAGIEPAIELLQSSALPLGDPAECQSGRVNFNDRSRSSRDP